MNCSFMAVVITKPQLLISISSVQRLVPVAIVIIIMMAKSTQQANFLSQKGYDNSKQGHSIVVCMFQQIKNSQIFCLFTEQQMRCTCLGLCMVSWVVAVAAMALLLPGLSCRDSERPDTSCTPRSVMLTLSSRILTVLSARTESDRGDITWRK